MTGRGLMAGAPLFNLAMVRQFAEKTQVDVTKASGMYQADVSKLENLDSLDRVQISTLRRYAKALGAEVRIVIELDGHRYTLSG